MDKSRFIGKVNELQNLLNGKTDPGEKLSKELEIIIKKIINNDYLDDQELLYVKLARIEFEIKEKILESNIEAKKKEKMKWGPELSNNSMVNKLKKKLEHISKYTYESESEVLRKRNNNGRGHLKREFPGFAFGVGFKQTKKQKTKNKNKKQKTKTKNKKQKTKTKNKNKNKKQKTKSKK